MHDARERLKELILKAAEPPPAVATKDQTHQRLCRATVKEKRRVVRR